MKNHRVLNSSVLFAAVGAVALGIGLPAHAANLLINPGFEAPTEPAQVNSDVTGWTFQFDAQREPFANHSAGGSFGIWAKTFEPAGGGIQQNVGVTAGSTYTLSSYVFFESAYNTTSATIQLGLTWLDSGGGSIGTPAFFNILPSSNPPTNAWTLETAPGAVAPAGAVQATVFLGWDGGGTVPGQQSVFFDDADLEGVGTVPNNSAWAINGSGDWNLNGSWANGTVPNGVGAEADFFSIITANHTVFTDTAITAGILNFNNSHKYVIAGAGSLTLQASSGSAQVIVQQGTQEINLPTTIASNTVLNVATDATLLIADPITINAGKTLTQTGGGTVTYQSIITVLGGAGLAFGNTTHAHQLNISATGNASIGGTKSLLVVDGLANSGTVDVNNNAMVIAYGTGADPTSVVRTQLQSGYNAGHWNGTGIKSTAAAADGTKRTAVGYAKASEIGITTLDGQSIAGNSLIVRYTYYGDSSLDGKVDLGNDFNLFLDGFVNHASGWDEGDYNYDNVVNMADFTLFLDGFAGQGGNLGQLDDIIANSDELTSSQKAQLLSVVPEPTAAGIMLVGSLVALKRKRR